MRPAKSVNSLANQQQQQMARALVQGTNGRNLTSSLKGAAGGPTSPICRCRVMYLGSSVPHLTKDGLQGIQEPLRELYPDDNTLDSGNAGIDSRLSVWSNGILIENIDETGRENKRFFKIDALHYCAAVKYVGSKPFSQLPYNPYTTLPNGNLAIMPKFLPLDSPDAGQANSNPPVFACILRRTTGIKVLECHAFICRQEAAANALVRCCFHAYADTMYAKQIGADISSIASTSGQGMDSNNNYRTLGSQSKHDTLTSSKTNPINKSRSKSIADLNDSEESLRNSSMRHFDLANQQNPELIHSSVIRRKSVNEQFVNGGCDRMDNVQQFMNNDLKRQQKFSKSMHHLNQNSQPNGLTYNHLLIAREQESDVCSTNQSTSVSCINLQNGRFHQQQIVPPPQQPFYNPIAARVPSYPPQSLIDATNGGGTLRSMRSTAANSIASTLLRSKKHAKAMSMAQLNHGKVASFHQPHSIASTTMGRPLMMPPVPPMFLSDLQARNFINGSQTMQPLNRSMIPLVNSNINFESMTPKEMKKLLKKSAKYGLDPSKYGENGLPILPFKSQHLPQPCHIPQHSSSSTMISQPTYSDIYGNELSDLASIHGMLPLPPPRGPILEPTEQAQMKPILVKPNPEFLKSKAGKKWLKQQKEFKKLLPPHLDGLPIIFGPPPINALEPAGPTSADVMPAPVFIPPHPGLPMMDSSGYYNPHPFYGQNGRASAASTLLRYSPHSQIMHEGSNRVNGTAHEAVYMPRHQMAPPNNSALAASTLNLAMKDYSCDSASLVYGNNECGIDVQNRQLQNTRDQQRNHMVEQSVISLGDENEYDEENDEQLNDCYSTAECTSNHEAETVAHSKRSSKTSHSGAKSNNIRSYQEKGPLNQRAYESANHASDDQGSYSSGIYKRGHINERAFSYSIRQEHKSGSVANSDVDYTSRVDTISNDDHTDQECHMNLDRRQSNDNFQNKQICTESYYQDNNTPSMPVDELTSRLENQLNMKSFTNCRIKSHM